MERRSFIKGLLVSASAGTALIQLATPEETSLLKTNEPTVISQSEFENVNIFGLVGTEVYMRDRGSFKHVGYITSISTSAPVDNLIHHYGTVQMKSDIFLFRGVNYDRQK